MNDVILKVDICLLVFTFITCLCFRYHHIDFLLTANLLDDIITNWSLAPVFDIVKGIDNCPESYSPLVKKIWSGTEYGCYCDNLILGKYLEIGKCSVSKIRHNCKNVPPKRKFVLNKWRESLLCTKRLELNYNILIKTKKECKLGYKICGKVDTLGNYLCIEQTIPCPINKILIESDSNPPNDFNYTRVNLNKGSSLYFTRENTEGFIFIDFRVEDGLVCINPLSKDFKGNNVYPFINDKELYGCTKKFKDISYDERYKTIDSIQQTDFYKENNLSTTIDNLPMYDEYMRISSGKTSLYTRPYIGWSTICNHEKILNSSRYLKSYLWKNDFILWVDFLIFFVYLFIVFIKLLKCGIDQTDIDNFFSKERYKKFDWFTLFFCTICLIFIIILGSEILQLIVYFDIKSVYPCGDNLTELMIDDMNKGTKERRTKLIYTFFLQFILCLILLFRLYNLYKVEDNQSSQTKNGEEEGTLIENKGE